MKKLICSVLIDSNLIKEEDVLILNKLNSDIHFEATGVSGWLSRAEVLVLIDLAKNLEYDAAYRTLKYVLMESVSLIAGKRKRKKSVTITVICDGRAFPYGGGESSERKTDGSADRRGGPRAALRAGWQKLKDGDRVFGLGDNHCQFGTRSFFIWKIFHPAIHCKD